MKTQYLIKFDYIQRPISEVNKRGQRKTSWCLVSDADFNSACDQIKEQYGNAKNFQIESGKIY